MSGCFYHRQVTKNRAH